MDWNRIPIHASSRNIAVGQVSAANANRDGTGTLVTLLTGSANGQVITRVDAKSIVTTTAGAIRFFVYEGANNRLVYELPVSANTVSASNPGFAGAWTPAGYGYYLPSGYILKASTEAAEATNLTVHYDNC